MTEDEAGGRGRQVRGYICCDAAAKREAQEMDGDWLRQEGTEGCIGCLSVLTKIGRGGETGAFAVSRVVKDQGGYVLLNEQVLSGLPVGEAVADAVEEKDCSSWGGGGYEDGFEGSVGEWKGEGAGWVCVWNAVLPLPRGVVV